MTESAPSIFNDVLGPVMRGPSSSHSAAGNRIGHLCRDLVGGRITVATVDYDPNGSLVTTHKDQGTDMGLYGGFLGWDPDDPRLPDYLDGLAAAGVAVEVRYRSYGAEHPNTYSLHLVGDSGAEHTLTAISLGGGMIAVQAVDGTPVTGMTGDACETLFYRQVPPSQSEVRALGREPGALAVTWCPGKRPFLRLSTRQPLSTATLNAWRNRLGAELVRVLHPVLPVLAGSPDPIPFLTCEQMLAWNEARGLDLWQLALAYESARAGMSEADVLERTRELLGIFENAVQTGLAGTEYADRLLPAQSPRFAEQLDAGTLVQAGAMNRIVLYVSAIMEVKSAMGVIVAAPTAGSCGAMPGAVLGVADAMELDADAKVRALLVAGLIGVFIAHRATFAAEVGGCMAECGSGAGMAAAAIASLTGGSLDAQLGAASMALQNSFGMICDPIANRVEAPCLGKNTMAATNALACANMALAGYRQLVPLDEVLAAMDAVGNALPHELCCTAKGGLSVTPTSRRLAEELNRQASSVKPGC